MKTGKIYLIRHGESTGNTRGAFLGQKNAALTEHGHDQARALGERLRPSGATALVSSPLKRAKQTAETISACLDLPVEIEPALIEQDFGLWDGATLEEVAQSFPEDYRKWIDGPPSAAPTQGESLEELCHRLQNFWGPFIDSRIDDETVLLVTHASVIQASLCLFLNTDMRNVWPYQVKNGSYARISFSPHGVVLDRLNPL